MYYTDKWWIGADEDEYTGIHGLDEPGGYDLTKGQIVEYHNRLVEELGTGGTALKQQLEEAHQNVIDLQMELYEAYAFIARHVMSAPKTPLYEQFKNK